LRPYWFFVHWLLGTGAVILGITDIFIGIYIYQAILQKHIPSLNTASSILVAFWGLLYVLQDRLSYIISQGKPQSQESRKDKVPPAGALGNLSSPTVWLVSSLSSLPGHLSSIFWRYFLQKLFLQLNGNQIVLYFGFSIEGRLIIIIIINRQIFQSCWSCLENQ
jgi:hypothetical protein